ncbi:MAG: NADP-dependent oxidoreductase [Bacteroidota bacterium]
MKNRQFLLASRPKGFPVRENWDYVQTDVPEPGEGEVLVQTQYISLDPAMRGWMNDARSYIRPVNIGEVMRAGTAGVVVKSNDPKFKAGDHVTGNGGVQDYFLSKAKHLIKVDTSLVPLPTYLGTLGMPGMTAYFGILEVGALKDGETVLVSGAAGAVGSVVGQIAKIKGCKVIGIAGGPDKCKYIVEELGYDAAIDYKNEHVRKTIRKHAPEGIDVYFDNVGGSILEAALANLKMHARIPICGAISQYNATSAIEGPRNYLSLLVNRARMEGFVVFDYQDRYMQAAQEMAGWMMQGKLKSRETIVEGIETFPDTMLRLFSGEKLGKLVLKA